LGERIEQLQDGDEAGSKEKQAGGAAAASSSSAKKIDKESSSDEESGSDESPDLEYFESEVARAEKAKAPKLTSKVLKELQAEIQTEEIKELIKRLEAL
jgi:hypothetical protein